MSINREILDIIVRLLTNLQFLSKIAVPRTWIPGNYSQNVFPSKIADIIVYT